MDQAADLKPGDHLHTGGGTATVLLSWRFTSNVRTYNLTVDGPHTYYVTAGVATPVLVQNGTPCDLSVAGLKPGEFETAQRLMADPEYNGGQLRGFEEENAGEDFIDENGKTYDAVGTPKAYQYWSEEKFLASLRDHLYRKSADFTVPDVTGASSEQVDVIFANMDSWVKGATSSSPAIIVGEY